MIIPFFHFISFLFFLGSAVVAIHIGVGLGAVYNRPVLTVCARQDYWLMQRGKIIVYHHDHVFFFVFLSLFPVRLICSRRLHTGVKTLFRIKSSCSDRLRQAGLLVVALSKIIVNHLVDIFFFLPVLC